MIDGTRHLTSDQDNATVRALRNNLKYDIPLILIIGQGCIATFTIPHRYCVLGWFRISHMWQEGDLHRWTKIRFESLESGWWQTIERFPAQIESRQCPACDMLSPIIYTVDICFNPACIYFFRGGGEIQINQNAANAVSMTNIPFSIIPPILGPQNTSIGISHSFRRGWRCLCGRLNCRMLLDRRECASCGNVVYEERPIYTADQLRNVYAPHYTGLPLFFNRSQIEPKMSIRGQLRILHYQLDEGSIYHMKSLAVDDLFVQYQRQSIDFRRRSMKTQLSSILCNSFTHNAGAHYKFHVQTSTQPLLECPPAIQDALKVIMQATNLVIEATFNELLSIVYLEGQKMAWHDDGEQGVGPIIASLSMGSTAYMSFRRKCQAITMKLQLDHGDIVVMTGSLQAAFDHRIEPTGFRIAATARYIT